MRWIVLLLTATLLGVGLYQVRNFDLQPAPRDEVLAYEVTNERNVQLPVHAGIEQVTVATWPVLALGLAREEAIGYGIEVLLADSAGRTLEYRRFDASSRVVMDPDSPDAPARLADGSALVGGSRAIEIDVSRLKDSGGTMTITAALGAHNRVLLLATHKIRRNFFEQTIVERSVGAEERTRVMGRRSSLGFFDLPLATRMESLAYRTQRLTALGREGVSYQTRRLMLGESYEAPPINSWGGQMTAIGPARHLALNVLGTVTVTIAGAPGLELDIREGANGSSVTHVIPKHSPLELSFSEEGARSLILQSKVEAEVALSVSEADTLALIGDVVRLPAGGRLPLLPDTRQFTYYRMSETDTVKYEIVSGQSEVGFSARIALANLGRDLAQPELSWFEVEWLDDKSNTLSRGRVEFRALRSKFETLEGAPVTDAQRGRLRIPAGAARLALRGAERSLLSLETDEPGVDKSILSPAYAMDLEEGLEFRNAPFLEKTWAVVRPENLPQLVSASRAERVHAQVRIEQDVHLGQSLSERELSPVEAVKSRHVFTPTTYATRFEFPTNAWTELEARPKLLTVPADGRVELVYLAKPSQVGETWSLFSSEGEQSRILMTAPAGRRIVELLPGSQEVRTVGLGDSGTVMARAAPSADGKIFRRHTNYALAKSDRLRFRLDLGEGELASVVLLVTTLNSNRDVALKYRLSSERVAGALREVHLYHRATSLAGELHLRTGARGRALLWSAEGHSGAESLPDRVGSVTLPVGDDLGPGTKILELSQTEEASDTLWMRAISVGRRASSDELRWIPVDESRVLRGRTQ
ncbi:MAG: hypothetical protein RJA70_2998 [Pseudomonadota bacterium]|jgi:hypothetical protein